MAAFLPDSLVQAEAMEDCEDGAVACKEVESALKSCTEASINGEVDEVKMDQQSKDTKAVEEDKKVLNGTSKEVANEPGSSPGNIGYLALSGGRLTVKTCTNDVKKANSTVNGCDTGQEKDEKTTENPTENPDKVIHEPNVSHVEAIVNDSGKNDSVTDTTGTSVSPIEEKDTPHTEESVEVPPSQQASSTSGPQCPETGVNDQKPANPPASICDNSCDDQQGSNVDDEKDKGLDGSPNSAVVTEKETLVDEKKESDPEVMIVGEENAEVSGQCQPSPLESSDVKDSTEKTVSSETTVTEDQSQGFDSKSEAAKQLQSTDSVETEKSENSDRTKESAEVATSENKSTPEADSALASENSESSEVKSINSSDLLSAAPADRVKSQCSPSKSTARKSVPSGTQKFKPAKATARKTGQPQATSRGPHIHNNRDSGDGTIKIFNLHPNSNITLKLSELEKVLKCPKAKDTPKSSVSGGTESGTKKENSTTSREVATGCDEVCSSPEHIPSDISSFHVSFDGSAGSQSSLKLQHKRRRKKGGTYDFPGGKKHAKKKKGALMSAAGGEGLDREGSSDDSSQPRTFTKSSSTSTRKQYTVIDLFRNRPFHKRQTTHEGLMRRRAQDNSLLSGKTVSQILNERRLAEAGQSEGGQFYTSKRQSEHRKLGTQTKEMRSDGKMSTFLQDKRRNAREHAQDGSSDGEGKRMVQKLFVTKDGLVSSVDIEDASERENIHHGSVRKRKPQGGSATQTGSFDGPASKKSKTGESENSQLQVQQPMVMVVAQHSQNAPGLRSILPKPHMASAIAMTAPSSSTGAAPVVVSAGQKLLLASPPLFKPGTKVAFVPVSGKSSFSLVPAAMVPAGKGGAVPATVMSSLPKMFNLRPTLSPSKNSDALRALLSSANGPRLKPVSVLPGSIPAPQRISVPSSMVTSGSFAQPKVLMSSSSSSSSLLSSSSSSKSSGSDVKAASSIANGMWPVTPPKTPEGEAIAAEGIPKGPGADKDVIPLCCCKIVGAFFTKQSSGVTYCQALDTVDGKALGCCNKVSNFQLVRPGVKIPFMAVCEVHRKRLKMHQCCPGCGIFCTQGKFYQCRKDGNTIHNFHRQCQISKNDKLYCPHCGEESAQVEVTLALNEPQSSQSSEQIRANLRKSMSKARMAPPSVSKKKATEEPASVSVSLPNSKTVSSDGLPIGPDRESLEKLMHLCNNKSERPKKYRVLPKNMYGPASEGDMGKVFYMLMDGMDPNQTCEEEDNQTVLHAAVYSANLALVYLLVQAGACLHTPDKTLKTSLMCAAEYGHLAILQFLTKAGARLDDRGEDHMTCLHYAAKAGHTDIIQYILDIEAIDVNATDEGGWTPLMWATESQMVEVVKFLVSRGGDPNKKDNEENNALHWAAYAGSVEIAELFMDLGCELDTPNEHGDTPLHIAARQNHYEVVVILLARGAIVEVKNNKDETPVSCCTNPNSPVCMALKVNKQLRSFAARLSRPEKLVHRDVSVGRERNPIACVNAVDDEPHPSDYLYINHNVETQDLHINNVITSLQSCRCKDDCSSVFCVCSRSSVKCWFDKFGRLIDEFNVLDPPLIFECNRACRCWVNCNNRVVQNGITVRMQVFRTKGRGWGVRSLMDIPKGTFICEYIGELISDQEADRREDDSYLFDLDNKDGDTYCLDARKYGNVSRFINHLCEPNLVPVKVFVDHQDLRFPRICFFSSRDIKAYEEFGFDYGEKFWIIKWKQFTCACGSPKCKYSTDTIQRTLEEYRLRHEEEDQAQDVS